MSTKALIEALRKELAREENVKAAIEVRVHELECFIEATVSARLRLEQDPGVSRLRFELTEAKEWDCELNSAAMEMEASLKRSESELEHLEEHLRLQRNTSGLRSHLPRPKDLQSTIQAGPPSELSNVITFPVDENGHLEFEATADDIAALRIARQQSGIACMVVGDMHCISWQVDVRVLASSAKQVNSHKVIIDLPELGSQPFKIFLYPKMFIDNGKYVFPSFKEAKGKGKVYVKFAAQLSLGPQIGFGICVGDLKLHQLSWRGPVVHDFSERRGCGLANNEDEWDFHAAVDESGHFVVSVALWPCAHFLNTGLEVAARGAASSR